MGGESREGWAPFIRRQWDDFTSILPSAPTAPPRRTDTFDPATVTPTPWSQLGPNIVSGVKRAGSSISNAASKLYNDYQAESENPVSSNIKHGLGFYKSLLDKYGPSAVDTGSKVLGNVAAVTTDPVAKGGAAYWDVIDPRNTGSEHPKPISDVPWEMAKAAKHGLMNPTEEHPELARELGQRAGPTFINALKESDPLQVGYQGFKLGLNSLDTANLGGEKIAAGLVGAGLHGAGALAHMAGVGAEGLKEAAIPMWLAKKQQNIKRFTHGSPVESEIESMVEHGFRTTSGDDVLERYAHAGWVTPEEVENARRLGQRPESQNSSRFGDYQMPVDFPDNMLALNLFEPVPKEDIQDIVDTLHPVHDARKIENIWKAWDAQKHLVVDPADQISGKVPFKSVQGTPDADLVRRLENELKRDPVKGINRKGGQAPLNHPDMPTASNSRWGATFYHDGGVPSLAFDPRVASVTDLDETKPWKPLGLYKGKTMPSDLNTASTIKEGLWTPAQDFDNLNDMHNHVNDIKTHLQDYKINVDPNTPLGSFLAMSPEEQAKTSPKTAHKLASDYLHKQGSANAGHELDDLWESKLQANEEIADKAENFHWDIVNSPSITPQDKAAEWHALSPEVQQAYKSKWPDDYNKNIKTPTQVTSRSTSTLPNAPMGSSPSGTQEWMQKHPKADEHYITQVANGVHDPANSEDDLAELFTHQLNGPEAYALQSEFPSEYKKYKALADKVYGHTSNVVATPKPYAWGNVGPKGKDYIKQNFPITHSKIESGELKRPAEIWAALSPSEQAKVAQENPITYMKLSGTVAPQTTKKVDVHAGTPISQAVSDIQKNTSLNAQIAAYNKLSLEDQAVHAYNYPNTNKKITAAIQSAPTEKFDVVSDTGNVHATFHAKSDAWDWINENAVSADFGVQPHDPDAKKAMVYGDYTKGLESKPVGAVAPPTMSSKGQSASSALNEAGHFHNDVPESQKAAKWAELSPEAQETYKNYYSGHYAKLEKELNKPALPTEASPAAPGVVKHDVFDQGSGQTLATFNSVQEAKDWMAKQPNGKYLDHALHDPGYNKHKDFQDFTTPTNDGWGNIGVESPKIETPPGPVEAPKTPKTLKDTTGNLKKTWDNVFGDNSTKTLEEKTSLWNTIHEDAKKIYRQYLPDEVGKLEAGSVEPPKQELPNSWQQFTKTAAQPKLDDPIGVLKKKYPELAAHFAGHSGTEMGSIEKHTQDVLREWENQISFKEISGIGGRFGHEVDGVLRTALPLHDIGKAEAIKAGNKANQHKHTIPIMQDILKKEGYNEKEIGLATELFNHDLLGSAVQGHGSPEQLKKAIIDKANKVGMNSADFARLQMAVYESDAASYPFITQYMKKDSSGRWTFSGNKKLAGIESLLKAKK